MLKGEMRYAAAAMWTQHVRRLLWADLSQRNKALALYLVPEAVCRQCSIQMPCGSDRAAETGRSQVCNGALI